MKYINIIIITFLFTCNCLFSKEKTSLSIETKGNIQVDNIKWYGDVGDDFMSGYKLDGAKISINIKDKKNNSCFLGLSYKDYLKLNNAFINIIKNNEWSFRIGKMTIPVGLEDTILPENRTFMEPVLLKADGKCEDYYGIELFYQNDIFNIRAAIFEESILYSKQKKKENKTSWRARGFMNPNVGGLTQHFGISYKVIFRKDDDIEGIFIRDNPIFDSPNSVLYSQIATLPKTGIFTAELIEIWKSLCLQGEISFVKAHWMDYDEEEYKSAYLQLSVFLTGESNYYSFNSGTIFKPSPKHKFGALELAFRINITDITNKGSLMRGISACDGKKLGITFGMNWYIGTNFRIQGNYTRDYYDQRLYNERAIQALGLRAQFVF